MLTDKFNGYTVALVQSVEDMVVLYNNLNKAVMVGIDTETTGLNFNKDHVVGYCISAGKTYSPEDYVGYYIPVRHDDESQNLPIDRVVNLVQHIMDNYKTMFFNRNYDFHMMEKDGVKISLNQQWHDSQVMVWEATQDKRVSLKGSSKKYLKRPDGSPFEVIEYEENGAKEGSFATVDPRVGFRYAAGDPILTVLLGRFIWRKYPEIHKIYSEIDNRFLEAIRYFNENAHIYFDYDLVDKMLQQANRELADMDQKIFDIAGYEFNIGSPVQKVDVLLGLGIKLTVRSKSGKTFATDKSVLKSIDHPICKLLTQRNELAHTISTYYKRIKSFETLYPNGITVSYKPCHVPTGRLACGADKANTFFAPLNMQGIKKMEVFKYVHLDDQMGYRLDMNPEGAIGKIKTKGGLRDAFIAPEGWCYLGADFAAEELRVAANYSREPNLIEPILKGEDIHKYVAIKMFGHYEKCHRTAAKGINFLVIYGGGTDALAARLGITKAEAESMFEKYFKTMKNIEKWIKSTIAQAKRDGKLFSAFGRPRHLASMFNSPKSNERSKAERLCVNFLCQGTGGDIIRMVLIRLHNKFLTDPVFAENVRFAATIHDEVQLLVRKEYLSEASKILCDCMYFKPESFAVPICAEPMAGESWGTEIECKSIVDNKIILEPEDIEPLTDDEQKLADPEPDVDLDFGDAEMDDEETE